MASSEELLDEIRERVARHADAEPGPQVAGLVVSRYETSEPEHQVTEPLFVLMAQGGKRLYFDRQVIEYRAGDCLVVTASMPLSGHFINASPGNPALAVGLRLAASKIAALLPQMPESTGEGQPPEATIGTHPADNQLLDAAARMLRLLEDPADAAVLAPLIEREILWRLLRGPLGGSIMQLGLADSVLNHVGRAITKIREDLAEPAQVATLAGAAGMSLSTFHRHFRRLTGTSPLQFQKSLRLQEARSLLVTGGNVTEAARLVGYSSPTQFNREYRRQFGLPPGRDIAQLRSRAARPGAG
jgi:AraC-like DNA-binding protein